MVNRLWNLDKQQVTHWFTMSVMELSITDTAQSLGISPNTVRRKLSSGLLTGNKVDGKWFINVVEPELPRAAPLKLESLSLVQHLEALITTQEAELSSKSEEIHRLRGLLSERALKTAVAVVEESQTRLWWQIWRET